MLSPNSSENPERMSAKPFLLWGVAGLLGIVALGALVQSEPKVITLERGLGPEVVATSL